MTTTKSFALALFAIACLVIGVLGAMLSLLPSMVGFAMFFVGGALGLAALVWGLIVKVRKSARGGALAAAAGAVPFLVVAGTAAMMAGKAGPGINDITTDVSNPPNFAKTTEHGDYPADFVEKAAKAYPKVRPLTLTIEPSAAAKLAFDLATDRGWKIVDRREDGFEAYEQTRLFRFRDDFVVRVGSSSSGGSVVDMRSASRDGKADFGVNAARIESFLEEMTKRAR